MIKAFITIDPNLHALLKSNSHLLKRLPSLTVTPLSPRMVTRTRS